MKVRAETGQTSIHRSARDLIPARATAEGKLDPGLITFDDSLRVLVSPRLEANDPPVFHRQTLLELRGRELRPPPRFAPDRWRTTGSMC